MKDTKQLLTENLSVGDLFALIESLQSKRNEEAG
jgi:hypothetical protein